MSATSAPFGLRPAFHPSGLDRAQALAGGIASAYNTDILKGQPVKYDTNGNIVVAAGGDAFVGAFAGVEWTDTTGRRRVSNYWPANTAYQAGSCVAYFYNDPNIVYEIQADGTLAQSSIGDEADLSNTTAGSTTTGLSACTLSTTLAGANSVKQMRIVDIAPYPDNNWGDAYVIVRATIAQFQFGQVRVSGANYTPIAI
ncbi:MAG: hypothetical protein FGM60_04685 [Candidatus Planktophila sp.]|nr:hypothetical protein [Candidatus Planktophila sp.]